MEMAGRGIFLMAVCVIASFCLAMTNKATAPLIEKQRILQQQEALLEVLPGATQFEEIANDGDGPEIYFIGTNESDDVVGIAFEVEPKGYAGPIVTMVGMDSEANLTGIKILQMVETPGLGAKADDEEYTSQYKGLTVDKVRLTQKDGAPGEIDAITAATISSLAVTRGVREGMEVMKNVYP